MLLMPRPALVPVRLKLQLTAPPGLRLHLAVIVGRLVPLTIRNRQELPPVVSLMYLGDRVHLTYSPVVPLRPVFPKTVAVLTL